MKERVDTKHQIIQSQNIDAVKMNSLIRNFNNFGWNTSKNYIKKLLSNKTNYIFYIKIDEEIIASIFVSNYLNRGWIGNSFTRKDYRGLGYNSLIVSHIREKCKIPLYLICRTTLLKHYEKLGFKNLGRVYELLIENDSRTPRIRDFYNVNEILAFDNAILGGNRNIKIDNIVKRKSTEVFVLKDNENIKAYGLISGLKNSYRIGPVVFNRFDDSIELFKKMIHNNSIKRKHITAFVHEKHLNKLYETKINMKIIAEYRLMGTNQEMTAEIDNQLFFYGRATG